MSTALSTIAPFPRLFSPLQAPLFTETNPPSAAAVVAKERRLLPGKVLFNKGDAGTTMFLIVHGEIKVHDGDLVFARLGDRKIIGELAALSSESRTASVTAVKKTHLLKISQESLYEIMWDHPEVAKGFIQVLIDRLRNLIR